MSTMQWSQQPASAYLKAIKTPARLECLSSSSFFSWLQNNNNSAYPYTLSQEYTHGDRLVSFNVLTRYQFAYPLQPLVAPLSSSFIGISHQRL